MSGLPYLVWYLDRLPEKGPLSRYRRDGAKVMDISLAELESRINSLLAPWPDVWADEMVDIMSLVEKYAEQRYQRGRWEGIYDDNKNFPRMGW